MEKVKCENCGYECMGEPEEKRSCLNCNQVTIFHAVVAENATTELENETIESEDEEPKKRGRKPKNELD